MRWLWGCSPGTGPPSGPSEPPQDTPHGAATVGGCGGPAAGLPCPARWARVASLSQITDHGRREHSSSLQRWAGTPTDPATARNGRSRDRARPSCRLLSHQPESRLIHSFPGCRPPTPVGGGQPRGRAWTLLLHRVGAGRKLQRPATGASLAVWQLGGPWHALTCRPPLPPQMGLEPAPPPQQDRSQAFTRADSGPPASCPPCRGLAGETPRGPPRPVQGGPARFSPCPPQGPHSPFSDPQGLRLTGTL